MHRIVKIEQTRVAKRLGRRGLLLVTGGLAYVGIWVGMYLEPRERFSRPGPIGNVYLNFMDSQEVALLWLVCGIIATATGVLHSIRTVMAHDALGFNALVTPPLLWTLAFVWSWITYLVTDGAEGRSSSLYATSVWTMFTLFIIIVAGWREAVDIPLPKIPPPPKSEE